MMKKIIILGIFALSCSIAFAGSNAPKIDETGKLYGDTISRPKIIGGATVICRQNSCLSTQIKKIEGFNPKSYLILCKIGKADFVKVPQGTAINEVLKKHTPKEITIMAGKIEISGVPYDVEHLIILD